MRSTALWIGALALLAAAAKGEDVPAYEDAIDLSRNIGNVGSIESAAFSPDGKTLATAGRGASVALWDADAGRIRRQLTGHDARKALAYSPDGSELAAGCSDGTLLVWDAETGALKAARNEHQKRINSLVYSPDGKTLLSAGDGILIWDAEKKELIKSVGERTKTYRALTLSSDGSAVAAAVIYGSFLNNASFIEVRDVDSGALKRRIDPERIDNVFSLSFSPDGRTLAGGGFFGIELWDVETGEPINVPEKYSGVGAWGVHFLPDGERIALFLGKSIVALDLNTGEQFRVMSSEAIASSEAVSLDGERAALGFNSSAVQIWNLNDGSLHAAFESDNTGPILSAVFSRDSKTLAVGSGDGGVRLWDVAALRYLRRLWLAPYSYQHIESVDFSKDGKTVLGGSFVDIALWDVATGRFKRALGDEYGRHVRNFRPAVYSPDGETIASIRYVFSDDGGIIIELRDADTGEATKEIVTDNVWLSMSIMDYSPDGQTIAYGGSQFFDVETGRLRATVTHHDTPGCFAYSPDGQAFAVGHYDGTVTVWNAQTYKRIRTILAQPVIDGTPSYARYVRSVAYSPDGGTLASGGVDGLVRLWEAETGELKAVLKGHTGSIEALAYSPDGRYLVSGAYDGSLLLWNARRGEQAPIQWADIRLPEEAADGGSASSAPALLPNYPNPFNPETWIPFDLAETSSVRIFIYNEAGELTRELNLGTLPSGAYRNRQKAAHWDGRNALGERAASGIYFARIQTEMFTAQRRMLLLK